MNKLSFNSLDPSIFRVQAEQASGSDKERAEIVTEGQLLFAEKARGGVAAVRAAAGSAESAGEPILSGNAYKQLNKTFQAEHLLYAARRACAMDGRTPPEDFEQFRRKGQEYYRNKAFLRVLQVIYQDIVTPILPRVYSEAVGTFAEMVEVGFGETYALPVGSGDIPVFQDSAWGSARSVPANRFYSKDFTLNPQPKTAETRFKWMQLVGNMDFGTYFANLVAGMYAKTMAMWNATLTAAATGYANIPAGLTGTFSATNWVTIANKLAAVNNTRVDNLFATGSLVALSKVLPTQATGTTNVSMDAALSTLLGRDYVNAGYLGKYMGVRLLPLSDAVVPGTQFGSVDTVLSGSDIWLMSGNGRKPLAIAYNADTPITIEIRPEMTASLELIVNLTIALDAAAVFSSRMAHITA